MKKLKSLSAYGGKGFSLRTNEIYPHFTSEFQKLKRVVLYIPGSEIHNIANPNAVQHLERINSKVLASEIKAVAQFFKKNKIEVVEIKKIKNQKPPVNLCFARDLFWSSPKGIIISRMGSLIRATEEPFILRTLLDAHEKIFSHMSSPCLFEGADILWLTPKDLLIGINNRTNLDTAHFLKTNFSELQIHITKLPKNVQHLLGMVQIIDSKKVMLRKKIASKSLISLLQKLKFHIIPIEETYEVTHLQAMNIVTIAPNKIIMPDDCPETEAIYLEHKINIVKKFKITELRKAAGGLACLTGILQRKS